MDAATKTLDAAVKVAITITMAATHPLPVDGDPQALVRVYLPPAAAIE